MSVLVIGATGQLGQDLMRAFGDAATGLTHQELDVTDGVAVASTMHDLWPDWVLNTAAFHRVDDCELNPGLAFAVNATGARNVARASAAVGAGVVFFSTDYVFGGEKAGFYTQRDDAEPRSAYGIAKLKGERLAQIASARTVVVRSGWIFGPGGKNFLATVVGRARRGERLKAITDAYGTPTYAPHLAARLRELAELDLPGVYHVVNGGAGASFYEFARAAAETAGCEGVEIEGVSMESLRRPAPRPRNSRLRCLLSEAVGLAPLPDWRGALREFAAQAERQGGRS